MKRKITEISDVYSTAPQISAQMPVSDIAVSLRKFIEQNYRGRVIFSRQNFDYNAAVLFDNYDFARMIKSVIKELTLERTCLISFSSTEDSFSIGFEVHGDTAITENSIALLAAEGTRLGISVSANSRKLYLTVPTRKLAYTALYEKDSAAFYRILCFVFTE